MQLQQAGNLTSAFQHIKTGLVHPRKTHVGADVAIYTSCGNKKHSTHTHTLSHMRFSLPLCFLLAIHTAPVKSLFVGKKRYHYNQQRSEDKTDETAPCDF